jgi:hypothetical protein
MLSLWRPAIRGQLAINRNDPAVALNALQASATIEFGEIPFVTNISCLYPTYVRGEAYLAAGQGKEAGAEFQKILDHSGIVWNCWTGALAHLGVARARTLCKRELHRGLMLTPPASRRWQLSKISSRSGKTPTPSSPSEASQSRVREAASIARESLPRLLRFADGLRKSGNFTF